MAKKKNRRPPMLRDEPKGRRKPCIYCVHNVEEVDYKQFNALKNLTSEKGKIRSRRVTGICRRHQVQAGVAIKRAREVAILPYA